MKEGESDSLSQQQHPKFFGSCSFERKQTWLTDTVTILYYLGSTKL